MLRYEPNSKSVAYCDGALWLFLTGDAQHGTVNNPGKHCADLKQKGVTKSGAYWIKPSQTDPAFQVNAYVSMQMGLYVCLDDKSSSACIFVGIL